MKQDITMTILAMNLVQNKQLLTDLGTSSLTTSNCFTADGLKYCIIKTKSDQFCMPGEENAASKVNRGCTISSHLTNPLLRNLRFSQL